MRARHHAALATFWFGLNFHWLPVSFVLLQSQVHGLIGHGREGAALGAMLAAGAVVGVAVPPLVGAWSDRLHTPWGRRRPIILTAGLANLLGLGLMMTAASYAALFAGYITVQVFANAAAAAYAALIPDVVPTREFGRASGYLAAMTLAGGGAGVAATFAVSSLLGRVQLMYALIGVVFLATMVPALALTSGLGSEPARPRSPRSSVSALRDFLRPLWKGDFAWVIFTRMMGTAGIALVASFLSFFFRDVVQVTDADQFTSLWLAVVFVVAIPFGITGGMISDRLGRKRFIYASGAGQTLVLVVFILLYPTQPWLVLGLGVLYGLSAGLYYAVDWALACDTLPDRANTARDMGLFHVAQTLPSAVAPALGGVVLDYVNNRSANSGYRAVFAAAIVFYILATVFVRRIRSVR